MLLLIINHSELQILILKLELCNQLVVYNRHSCYYFRALLLQLMVYQMLPKNRESLETIDVASRQPQVQLMQGQRVQELNWLMVTQRQQAMPNTDVSCQQSFSCQLTDLQAMHRHIVHMTACKVKWLPRKFKSKDLIDCAGVYY